MAMATVCLLGPKVWTEIGRIATVESIPSSLAGRDKIKSQMIINKRESNFVGTVCRLLGHHRLFLCEERLGGDDQWKKVRVCVGQQQGNHANHKVNGKELGRTEEGQKQQADGGRVPQ